MGKKESVKTARGDKERKMDGEGERGRGEERRKTA